MNLLYTEFLIVLKGGLYVGLVYLFGPIYDSLLVMLDVVFPSNIHSICAALKDIIGVLVALLVLIKVAYELKKVRKDSNAKTGHKK